MAYAAFYGEVDGVGGFAIGGVDVLAIFVSLEAVNIDGAEPAMDDGDYTDIFGQAHDRFANSTVNLRLKIFGAFAGEIDHGLPRADVYFETSEVHFRQAQIAFARTDINFQLNGNAVGDFQVPDVVGVADDAASAFLGDGKHRRDRLSLRIPLRGWTKFRHEKNPR